MYLSNTSWVCKWCASVIIMLCQGTFSSGNADNPLDPKIQMLSTGSSMVQLPADETYTWEKAKNHWSSKCVTISCLDLMTDYKLRKCQFWFPDLPGMCTHGLVNLKTKFSLWHNNNKKQGKCKSLFPFPLLDISYYHWNKQIITALSRAPKPSQLFQYLFHKEGWNKFHEV